MTRTGNITELLATRTRRNYPPGDHCHSRLTTTGRGERGYHTDRTPKIGTLMHFTGDTHTWTVRSTVTSRGGTVTTRA